MLTFLAALLLSLTSTPQTAPWIKCNPQGYQVDGGEFVASAHPLAGALSQAQPGSVVELAPGDYPPFRIGFGRGVMNADVSGTAYAPITVRAQYPGPNAPRIRGRGVGDALMIDQAKSAAFITFEGINFEPGYRSAIIFYRQKGKAVHRGFKFLDCDIIGGWDHIKAQGDKSKWGVSGHRLADFEWRGVTRPSQIRDIRGEHGFYLQNCAGDVTIANVVAKRLGRTFCQFTARANDGPAGFGKIVVRDCRISDTGLSAGDAYKGGSAFTVSGNMPKASFLFENNTYRAGFDPSLLKLTRKGVVYGTGAFVVWSEKELVRVGKVTLKDNDFRFAPGTGDRPVVSLSATSEVQLLGSNRFEAGAFGVALSFDAPRKSGVPSPLPLGKAQVAPGTHLKGRLEVRGQTAGTAERLKLGLGSPR